MARSFRDAGCSHILALSGMHLAIISAVIAFFLRKALGLRAAALAGSLIIAAYVYLAGGQPSLVRAAIMYLLGVLSLLGNMKVRPLNLLSLAFLIQLAWDPGAGASLSFILSYLALGGILLTGEALHELLRGKSPAVLAGGLSASAGAFLAGAAVVSLYFGVLRPVGILAGLLLMPLATVFMIGALGNLALCFIAPALAGPPGRLLSLLAGVQQALVTLAARAPGLPVPRPLPVLALSLLFAVLIGYGGWRRRLSRTSLAPFA
jgi:competence protein ComEC